MLHVLNVFPLLFQGNWKGNKASSHTAYTQMVDKWTCTQYTAPPQVLVLLVHHNIEYPKYMSALWMRACFWLSGCVCVSQSDPFLPTGQQDPYDKTSNNNTVEVSA